MPVLTFLADTIFSAVTVPSKATVRVFCFFTEVGDTKVDDELGLLLPSGDVITADGDPRDEEVVEPDGEVMVLDDDDGIEFSSTSM